jgi:hypothetical protein
MCVFSTQFLRRAILGMALLVATHASSSASILFQTGNQQYNQVNLTSTAPTAYTVLGHVRDIANALVEVQFRGYGSDQQSPVLLRSRNGAASIERVTAGSLYQLVISVEPGFVMTAGDFALDQENRLPDGSVSFAAYTYDDKLVDQDPASPASFLLRAKGQNVFNFTAVKPDGVTKLVITSLQPLADFKQLTLEVEDPPLPESAPEPGSLLTLAGVFSCWPLLHRRKRSR